MIWPDKEALLLVDLSFTIPKGKSYCLKRVSQITYLDIELLAEPYIRGGIQKRISAKTKCLGGLREVMSHKNITRTLKVIIYKVIIQHCCMDFKKRYTLSILKHYYGRGSEAKRDEGVQ